MLEIQREQLVRVCEELKSRGFEYLTKITAVDYGSHLSAVYILYNLDTKQQETLSVKLGAGKPSIHTIMHLFPAADWYERELSEMFGIRIDGREAPRLLLEEWNGIDAPLLKKFEWGKDYKKAEQGD